MAIWETRPETKAGPIWRARREEKVDSLMGSPEPGPPRPPRPPPPAAGGSSCAKADRERHKRSGNSLMDGSITHVHVLEREGVHSTQRRRDRRGSAEKTEKQDGLQGEEEAVRAALGCTRRSLMPRSSAVD